MRLSHFTVSYSRKRGKLAFEYGTLFSRRKGWPWHNTDLALVTTKICRLIFICVAKSLLNSFAFFAIPAWGKTHALRADAEITETWKTSRLIYIKNKSALDVFLALKSTALCTLELSTIHSSDSAAAKYFDLPAFRGGRKLYADFPVPDEQICSGSDMAIFYVDVVWKIGKLALVFPKITIATSRCWKTDFRCAVHGSDFLIYNIVC